MTAPSSRWLPQVSLSSEATLTLPLARRSIRPSLVLECLPDRQRNVNLPPVRVLRRRIPSVPYRRLIEEKEAASATYGEAVERQEPATC